MAISIISRNLKISESLLELSMFKSLTVVFLFLSLLTVTGVSHATSCKDVFLNADTTASQKISEFVVNAIKTSEQRRLSGKELELKITGKEHKVSLTGQVRVSNGKAYVFSRFCDADLLGQRFGDHNARTTAVKHSINPNNRLSPDPRFAIATGRVMI